MSQRTQGDTPSRPSWLIRTADQVGVAVCVAAALAASVGWWIVQGGWQGRLVEFERAEPLTARFEVDLNRAEWPELTLLPGIGETLAQRIVDSRRTDGPFADHDDLRRIHGIGPRTVERIRPYLRPIPSGRNLAGP